MDTHETDLSVVTAGRIPGCGWCGAPLAVLSEERVATVPPVFDLECRCSACGRRRRVRQILVHFE